MYDSKATTSSSTFANQQLQHKSFLYLTLSLSTTIRMITTTHSTVFPSYIYAYVTLGLFTNMTSTVTSEHIY